jgi:hypothetical protein
MGKLLNGIQQHITSMSQRLIRDDIKAGNFLNKRIKHSPTDYKQGNCYYIGDPIQLAVCFFDFGKMQHGWLAEFPIVADNGFKFRKNTFKEVLAIFFYSKYTNNIRLQALIPEWNEQALRLARLAGFQLEGKLRNVASDGDRLLFSILKEEYIAKWAES